jgi:Rha family phage regulatory protein
MTTSLLPDFCPDIRVVHDRIMTTSLAISNAFEKNHRDVLRAIQNLDCPKEFTERNFALSEYTDSTGRKLPMYLLTRDGFTVLAMGFTGKRAMEFKIRYIEAFNRMEEELRGRKETPRPAIPAGQAKIETRAEKLTREHQNILTEIVFERAHQFPEEIRVSVRDAMFKRVYSRFMVWRLSELADAFYPDVKNFLERMDLSGMMVRSDNRKLDLNFPRSSAKPSRSYFRDYPDAADGTLFIQDLLDPDYPDPLGQAIDKLTDAGYEVEGLRIQYRAMKGHLMAAAESFDKIYRLSRDRRMA